MAKQLAALLTVVAALSGLSGCETPPYYGGQTGDRGERDHGMDVRVVFSDADRRIIRDHYHENSRRLPPGLAKKGKIPPGHAFKLRRNQSVPPDVSWGYLDADIERRLSRLPDGYVRVVIGADIGILNTRTRIVVDLLEDINN